MTPEGWATEVIRLRGLPQGTALQLVDQAIAEGRLLRDRFSFLDLVLVSECDVGPALYQCQIPTLFA